MSLRITVELIEKQLVEEWLILLGFKKLGICYLIQKTNIYIHLFSTSSKLFVLSTNKTFVVIIF